MPQSTIEKQKQKQKLKQNIICSLNKSEKNRRYSGLQYHAYVAECN